MSLLCSLFDRSKRKLRKRVTILNIHLSFRVSGLYFDSFISFQFPFFSFFLEAEVGEPRRLVEGGDRPQAGAETPDGRWCRGTRRLQEPSACNDEFEKKKKKEGRDLSVLHHRLWCHRGSKFLCSKKKKKTFLFLFGSKVTMQV